MQGRLVGLIRNVENFNGYEALRHRQANARNRAMSLLQGIMAYPSFNMKSKGKDAKEKNKGKMDKAKEKGKSDGAPMAGKGKGGKGKGGKWKGAVEVCRTCGKPGHMSNPWRVRQVEAPTTKSVTSQSQQGSTPSTTMTSTRSGGDVSSKAIRRVSQPAVFDLRETSLTGTIRMIQESPRSSVE